MKLLLCPILLFILASVKATDPNCESTSDNGDCIPVRRPFSACQIYPAYAHLPLGVQILLISFLLVFICGLIFICRCCCKLCVSQPKTTIIQTIFPPVGSPFVSMSQEQAPVPTAPPGYECTKF